MLRKHGGCLFGVQERRGEKAERERNPVSLFTSFSRREKKEGEGGMGRAHHSEYLPLLEEREKRSVKERRNCDGVS